MGKMIQYSVLFVLAFVVAGCGSGGHSSGPDLALVGIWRITSISKDETTVACPGTFTANGSSGIFRLSRSCGDFDVLTYNADGTFTFTTIDQTASGGGNSKGTYTHNPATGSLQFLVTGASPLEAKVQISANGKTMAITPIVNGVTGPTSTLARQPNPTFPPLFDPHY